MFQLAKQNSLTLFACRLLLSSSSVSCCDVIPCIFKSVCGHANSTMGCDGREMKMVELAGWWSCNKLLIRSKEPAEWTCGEATEPAERTYGGATESTERTCGGATEPAERTCGGRRL